MCKNVYINSSIKHSKLDLYIQLSNKILIIHTKLLKNPIHKPLVVIFQLMFCMPLQMV